MIRASVPGNGQAAKIRGLRHARSRLTAGFVYVGPPARSAAGTENHDG